MDGEVDFLPAVLEIQERPPSPAGRAVGWSIMAFFSLAVLWSLFGKIDIVASAEGKIVPSGHVKVIQPMEIGLVRAIYVREGQHVSAGDLLIELDPTSAEADVERLDRALAAARLDQVRIRKLEQMTDLSATVVTAPVTMARKVSAEAALLQKDLLSSQWAEQQAQQAVLDSTIAGREAERDAIREEVKKLEGTLPLICKRANAVKGLVARKLSAEQAWLKLEEQRINQKQELAAQKSHFKQVQFSIQEARQQRQQVVEKFRHTLLDKLADTERHIQQLEQERVKAVQHLRLRRITAPVAGVVQQLAVHTIGGVVTPAQALMKLVPEDQRLEVEAWILNRDIGFVTAGQPAEVKVKTFPFTKYGTLAAKVIDVSNDAVTDKQKGLVYAGRIRLRHTSIQVGRRRVNLVPGMAVSVEVKTGQRRLIEYILSPLLRYKKESLGER